MAFGINTFAESAFASLGGGIANANGQNLSSNLGNIIVTADANVNITGQSVSINLGNTVVTADANVNITGQNLITAIGNVAITADAVVIPNGLSLSSNLGNTTVTADANVSITGQNLTTAVGNVSITADANVLVNGNNLNITTGNLIVIAWREVDTGTSVNYLNATPVFLPPSDTYSQLSTFSPPSETDRTSDFVFAIDVQGFDATDYGVLYEYGGVVYGHAISLEAGGQLYAGAFNSDSWQAAGQAYLQVDVSPYYNTAGTFYTTMDYSSGIFKLYFQPGGSNSGNQVVLLGTSTVGNTANPWAGTGSCGIGTFNGGMVNFGFTNYDANFTGTIDQFRAWYQTSAPIPFQGIQPSTSWNQVNQGIKKTWVEIDTAA